MPINYMAIKPAGSRSVASSRLRAFVPVKELSNRGLNIEIYNQKNSEKYDLVVFQKSYTNEDLELARRLKARSCKVVLDQCDNHFIYDVNSVAQCMRLERLRAMIDLVDIVICSTSQIAALFPNKKTYIASDFTDFYKATWIDRLAARKQLGGILKTDALKLVWFGSVGSVNPRFGMCDIAEKISLLNNLSSQYQIQLTIISNSESEFSSNFLAKTDFPVFYIDWRRETYQYILSMHDACLIPIDINPFTICKTNNRLILALYLSLPVIADVIPSYTEFSRFAKFGCWVKNLNDIAEDMAAERRVASRGREYVLENYSNEKIANIWHEVFESISSNEYSV